MSNTNPIALFYEANAGTGKTRILTDFILEAIEKGHSLQKICALTFTEKAANEMLDRLRLRVAEMVSAGKLDPLQMQLAGRCFIGTIHSFCLHIVTRYAPRIPLPPILEIDPQEESFETLFENRWDEYLSRLLRSRKPLQQSVIRSLGVEALRSMADILVRTRHDFRKPRDNNVQWLVDELSDPRKWQYRKGTWGWFLARLVPDYKRHGDVLSAALQTKKAKTPYATPLQDLLKCKTEEIHQALTLLKSDFVGPFLKEYHAQGKVRYDDLLLFARELLQDRHIRRELKERYDLLLVDEMQDTDPVQYEIILYLCERKEKHQQFRLRDVLRGTKKIALEPGKLFVVGDPKQSIYGFRNADLSAYEGIKRALQRTGAEIRPLAENHRSCPNLVRFTNRLAATLFPAMQPIDSKPARNDLCSRSSSCIHLVKISDPDSSRLYQKILSEAGWIARKIQEMVSSGRASYRDFGVLLRKVVNSHLYVDAFSAAGVRVIIEGERFFYRSQEIIDFINLLKFIVDPMDETALAGTLRSPLFGMSDRELALFFSRQEVRKGSLLQALNGERRKLMELILEIRKELHKIGPADLIDLVIKKLPVLSVAGLAYGTYRSSIAPLNILRIQKYAAEMQSDPACNVFHFVSQLSLFSREGKESGQEPLADEGLDAVRMMTIHNSKGLDFPVVFVPLTDYEVRGSGWEKTEVIYNWMSDQSGIKVNGITESNYLRLKYKHDPAVSLTGPESIDLEEEEKRVLYVAATRAKKEIYFCCLENGSGENILSFLETIDPTITVEEETSAAQLPHGHRADSKGQPFQPVLEEWEKVKKAAQIHSQPISASITREAVRLEPAKKDLFVIRSGATLVGLLCHSVLEKIDLQDSSQLDTILELEKQKLAQQYTQEQLQSASVKCWEILRCFLASESADWLRKNEIIGREIPVTYFARESGKILSGKIDLLVREGEKYWIVDYKTDASLDHSLHRRYVEQMHLYKQALSHILRGNLQARLLLIRTGEMIDC